MESSLIEWPRAQYWDKAYNPFIGCKPMSEGCAHCWAAAMARRFGFLFEPHRADKCGPLPQKGIVFCGNMTDLNGGWVRDEDKDALEKQIDTMNPKAAYLFLTKRPRWIFAPGAENVYNGFTAENQARYEERAEKFFLAGGDKTNFWVSLEPMLESVYLDCVVLPKMKWIVVGSESGFGRRPAEFGMVREIVKKARFWGIPVFVKQLEINGRCERDIEKFPEDLRVRQVPWRLVK